MNEFMNTPDTTGEYDQNDIQQNKVISIIAYIGILFFLPLVVCPNSKFGRFHANQALVLFIIEAITGIVSGVMIVIPVAGWIISSILGGILGIISLILMILGMVNAANGQAKQLPVIGGISIIK